jgi:hypothetical protein
MIVENDSRIDVSAVNAREQVRRPYRRPALVNYGAVSNLTKGAGTLAADGTGGFLVV